MKKRYNVPEIEITEFQVEDVITATNPGGGIVLPDDDWED